MFNSGPRRFYIPWSTPSPCDSYWPYVSRAHELQYWAYVPQLLKPMCPRPMLRKRNHHNEKRAYCNESVAPARCDCWLAPHSNRLSVAKNKKNIFKSVKEEFDPIISKLWKIYVLSYIYCKFMYIWLYLKIPNLWIMQA